MERHQLIDNLRRAGIRLRKSWSQNFLIDEKVFEEMVRQAEPAGRPIIELGAGSGELTERLAKKTARVLAVEKDRRLVAVLKERFSSSSVVEVIEANAARLDFAAWRQTFGEKPVVVGNLPYHMAAPILFRLLEQAAEIEHFLLMFQREMAERILAPAGHPRRGVLGLMVENRARVEKIMDIPPQAFFPSPQVHSTLLKFFPLNEPRLSGAAWQWFEKAVKSAFSGRRKTLRNSLRPLAGRQGGEKIARCLQSCGLPDNSRAQELSFEQFARLAAALAETLEPGQ